MAINDEAFDKIEGEIPIVNALSLSSKKPRVGNLNLSA
ncbi:hypothetical protein JCM19233_5517 [Vibrio astriarenae]|nr:hypothetical protein JCM19233_5517 [Vibrio sp. C7]